MNACVLLVLIKERAAAENTNSRRLNLTLRGAATVLFFSSTDADVCSAAGAGANEAGILSLFALPLVSTTAAVSLSFFLLSVLTMGWS